MSVTDTGIIRTGIVGLQLIEPHRHGDDRGWFEETWNKRAFADLGIDVDFVQDNHSLSFQPGTLRGLHFQAPPHAQDKFIRCTRGSIYDVAVDIRRGSETYGRWMGVELSDRNGRQLFIPKGFLHGFMTLTPEAEVQYKCSDYYAREYEGAVLWNSLGIDWPRSDEPVLSRKDAQAASFSDFVSPFVLGENS